MAELKTTTPFTNSVTLMALQHQRFLFLVATKHGDVKMVSANNLETAWTLNADLEHLMSLARKKRDVYWGKTITYSRKVFVPLTNMCRDTCGYCTFVKHPDDPKANIMSPKQVLKAVTEGQQRGCKEVLLSLGEKPELRYLKAKQILASLGYDTIIEYLRDICALIIDETDLLPHVNAGSLTDEEIEMLRPVSASMGMMLETSSKRLANKGQPHFACPDKMPVQRIRTLERAGIKSVPFTTGILIGIGETWHERLESLEVIKSAHQQYGHIQEVIIQNFQPKPGISMEHIPGPALNEMLRMLAIARIVLPMDVSLQAPPNLSDRHINYIKAGINDWGGISPVTIDFINPQHVWPEIEGLRRECAKHGSELKERLTIYPKYIQLGRKFVDDRMFLQVNNLARKDGLASDQYRTECDAKNL